MIQQMQQDTRPLTPHRSDHAEARNRIVASFGAEVGDQVAAADFDRSVSDLQELGLQGPGLLVAAEHMTTTRLRALNDLAINGTSELGSHD